MPALSSFGSRGCQELREGKAAPGIYEPELFNRRISENAVSYSSKENSPTAFFVSAVCDVDPAKDKLFMPRKINST